MPTHLIVDGYNLMGSSPQGGRATGPPPDREREELIEDLRRYKRVKGFRVTVVFDGVPDGRFGPQEETWKGIRVLFAGGAGKADGAIVRLVRSAPAGAVVVTSDRELATSCRQLGASVISSEEFGERLAAAALLEIKGDEEEDAPTEHAATRKAGSSRRLPSALRRDQRRLRKL
jgi:predicted RNA-binding protein with PIN domain